MLACREAHARARALLCLLACHAEWHMRKKLAPILLADLSTVVLNDVSIGESESFTLVTTPTTGQRKAFGLLGADSRRMLPQAGR